jgi:MFS family permease
MENPIVIRDMTASAGVRSGPTQNRTVASKETQVSAENAKKWKKSRNDRKQSYIAQASILFNVWGIPLSFGPYLEFYYTNRWRHPVLQVSSIIAVQIFCLLGAGVPVLWLYQHEYWRTTIIVASFTAIACQWVLYICTQWMAILLVQGFGIGTSLGTLYSMGTLILGSHHKNNYPLTSMVSVSASFLGAVCYTCIALVPMGSPSLLKTAYVINATITTFTLLSACFLMRRSDVTSSKTTIKITSSGNTTHKTTTIMTNNYCTLKRALPSPGHCNPLLESGTWLFAVGYILTFTGLFIYLFYSVLLTPTSPSYTFPITPTWHLIITYAVATLTAPFAANMRLRCTLGSVNTFIAATFVATACIIVPVWFPYPGVGIPYNILYGIALGTILPLHTKALSVFHWSKFSYHDDMPARVAVVQAVAGLFVAIGIVWTGWVVDHTGERGRFVWKDTGLGFGVGGTVAAYVMLGGAILMMWARWRRCPRFCVII